MRGKGGGLKTFLNLKCFFCIYFVLLLTQLFKYMSIILFTIHRVTYYIIILYFLGVNPQIGGILSPCHPQDLQAHCWRIAILRN